MATSNVATSRSIWQDSESHSYQSKNPLHSKDNVLFIRFKIVSIQILEDQYKNVAMVESARSQFIDHFKLTI